MDTSFSICLYRYKSISAPCRDSRCLTEQEYRDEPLTVGRVKSFGVKTRLPVASHHPPNSLAILPSPTRFPPTSIIFRRQSPSENTTLPAEPPLCLRGAARKRLSAHRCVIGENLPASLCVFFYFSKQNF